MEVTIGQRIRQKRKEFNWTQQELAKRLKDVSHVAISQWESNTTKPNAENLYELSVVLKCDLGWLLKGEGAKSSVTPYNNDDIYKIPVLNDESLSNIHDVLDIPISSHESEYIMTNVKKSEFIFAYRIADDSMKPDFVAGDMVVIETTLKPVPGEFVIAKIGNDIVFRKYQVESYLNREVENIALSPLNDDFPTLSSSRYDINLIGTMIEHRIYRRKR